MALGGGTFITQNKVLPGSYINFVSAARASATLSDRGVVALPISLDWGKSSEVFTITSEDFQKNSMKILGYDYTAQELMPFREIFKHANKVHVYRSNGDGSLKASNKHATAKYGGTRGNDLKLVIQRNLDDSSKFDVTLYLGSSIVDKQTVSTAAELVENDYVIWKSEALATTAGLAFTSGADGIEDADQLQAALDAFEAYNFNVLVCKDQNPQTTNLFVAYTKRMRDQVGVKFQLVENYISNADYEGVVSVVDQSGDGLIYWVAGALAGCAVNKSCTNMLYDGELQMNPTWSQSQLEQYIAEGKFTVHKVEDEIRVLTDINSLVTVTEEKGEVFKSNQVIRVIDQCANDTARIFNTKYLGKVQNDKSGRISFWNDIVTHRKQLETIRAIEDYDSDALIVEQGAAKNSVAVTEELTPTAAMEKLYMTTVIE